LEERLAVVNLYEELGSYRAVAAVVGCDHKTVKAWLERSRRGEAMAGVVRGRATDPFRHLIRERIEMTAGRVRGRRLLKLRRAAGYTGSLRTLQRALRIEKRGWQERQRRVYRPWYSAPGDFLIVDWGEVGKAATAAGQRKLYCFCAVLGWSRWRYVRFFTCQRFQVLAQGLAACFEAFGVPAHVIHDNPKTVTTEFVAGLSVLNAEMVRLAKVAPCLNGDDAGNAFARLLPVAAGLASPSRTATTSPMSATVLLITARQTGRTITDLDDHQCLDSTARIAGGGGDILPTTENDMPDPLQTARQAKETAALLREARALLRRIDKLAAGAEGMEPPTPAMVTALREQADRLVHHLARQEHNLQQRTKQAIRRGSRT